LCFPVDGNAVGKKEEEASVGLLADRPTSFVPYEKREKGGKREEERGGLALP